MVRNNFDWTIQTVKQHAIIRVGRHPMVILNKQRRICAQVRKLGLGEILRFFQNDLINPHAPHCYGLR